MMERTGMYSRINIYSEPDHKPLYKEKNNERFRYYFIKRIFDGWIS